MTVMDVDGIGIIRNHKENSLLPNSLHPRSGYEEHFKAMGKEWAADYEGRTASTVYIEKTIFEHGGTDVWFKDALYLLALGDQLIIEIRHSAIQK